MLASSQRNAPHCWLAAAVQRHAGARVALTEACGTETQPVVVAARHHAEVPCARFGELPELAQLDRAAGISCPWENGHGAAVYHWRHDESQELNRRAAVHGAGRQALDAYAGRREQADGRPA